MATRHAKQVSSCDSCKSLRIGCDLRMKRSSCEPCSNCKRRGRECVSQHKRVKVATRPRLGGALSVGLDRNQHTSSNDTASERPAVYLASPAESAGGEPTQSGDEICSSLADSAIVPGREDHMARKQLALTLHHILWGIFNDHFETQVGIWIGSECCPFKHTLTAPTTLISRLMITLDSTNRMEINPKVTAALGLKVPPLDGNSESINQALLSSVHAYTARWLPVEPPNAGAEDMLKMKLDLLRDLWSRCSQKIQPAMARPSYTSILALHLFGNTPTPSQSEERRMSELCLGIALQHYTTMSVLAGASSRISITSSIITESPRLQDIAAMEHAQMEDTAYWFGIVCDTSRSLIACQPSILLPTTAAESKIWASVQQEISAFQHRAESQHWKDSRVPMSIERLYSTVGNGSACKTMVWSAISKVQDALFLRLTDISVEEAINNALREMDRFEQAFGALLGLCRRDFTLLNEKIRTCSFLLDVEFSLGVLTLVDTLTATSNAHFLPSEYELRLSSARSIVCAVNLMLNTDHYALGNHSNNSNLLKVPYPENIINGLLRAGSSLIHLYNNQSVSASMIEVMFCVIFTGLEILQIISYSAREALESLNSLLSDSGIQAKSYQASSTCTVPPYEASAAIRSAVHDRDFFKWNAEHISVEPDLVNSTIESIERALGLEC